MEEPINILVADDDADMRRILQKTLEHEGFHVMTACDGKEAMAVLRAEPGRFHMLISDLRMPEKDGAQLLLEAKALNDSLTVIIISGCTELDQYLRLLKSGAFDYITKPFKIPDLMEIIDRALDSSQLRRA